jgi:hypothetical protein
MLHTSALEQAFRANRRESHQLDSNLLQKILLEKHSIFSNSQTAESAVATLTDASAWMTSTSSLKDDFN